MLFKMCKLPVLVESERQVFEPSADNRMSGSTVAYMVFNNNSTFSMEAFLLCFSSFWWLEKIHVWDPCWQNESVYAQAAVHKDTNK